MSFKSRSNRKKAGGQMRYKNMDPKNQRYWDRLTKAASDVEVIVGAASILVNIVNSDTHEGHPYESWGNTKQSFFRIQIDDSYEKLKRCFETVQALEKELPNGPEDALEKEAFGVLMQHTKCGLAVFAQNYKVLIGIMEGGKTYESATWLQQGNPLLDELEENLKDEPSEENRLWAQSLVKRIKAK